MVSAVGAGIDLSGVVSVDGLTEFLQVAARHVRDDF
jgi:hypothetical protein